MEIPPPKVKRVYSSKIMANAHFNCKMGYRPLDPFAANKIFGLDHKMSFTNFLKFTKIANNKRVQSSLDTFAIKVWISHYFRALDPFAVHVTL